MLNTKKSPPPASRGLRLLLILRTPTSARERERVLTPQKEARGKPTPPPFTVYLLPLANALCALTPPPRVNISRVECVVVTAGLIELSHYGMGS